jgi:hypothetical protein
MKRACHLHTTGFDRPDRRMISAVPQPDECLQLGMKRKWVERAPCGAIDP